MGAGGSSIAKCTNDFELVIRATKEMEWLLETYFDAPTEHDCGLHYKITQARYKGRPLKDELIRKMRYLVTIRNKLVHERGFNAIPDRKAFKESFAQVEEELQAMVPQSVSICVVS